MSGILYVVMAILVILVVTLTKVLRWSNRLRWNGLTELDRARALRLKDLDTFKMHLDAKDQQIADIRRETEDEMRKLFEDLVDSLHSEIDRLCEERSKLIRTVNLQADQLEKLDRESVQLEFNELKEIEFSELKKLAEKSEPSGISIDGVPMSHAELAEAQSNNDQSEYPIGPYGLHELSDLEAWDDLYETEVPSHKRGLWRGEEKLHNKVDNTRQRKYRQVTVSLRKARRLVEVQRLENERICPGCGEHCIMMRDEGGE